jgi:hypothetical protein
MVETLAAPLTTLKGVFSGENVTFAPLVYVAILKEKEV